MKLIRLPVIENAVWINPEQIVVMESKCAEKPPSIVIHMQRSEGGSIVCRFKNKKEANKFLEEFGMLIRED